MKSLIQFVDRKPAPTLLPILRSQQQGEILALLLSDPDLELSLTEIWTRTGAPHPSVHREVERAEQAGLVTSRKMGNVRLVRANTASPYYPGLADLLVLGDPDRDPLYAALNTVEQRLGRPVEATIRARDWLESGTGSFHETVTSRPMVKLDLPTRLRIDQAARPTAAPSSPTELPSPSRLPMRRQLP